MNKRFIAGAVCPKCAAMDRLVIYDENGATVRECIECGFTDTQKNEDSPEELKTRVNHAEQPQEPEDDDIQPVKILH